MVEDAAIVAPGGGPELDATIFDLERLHLLGALGASELGSISARRSASSRLASTRIAALAMARVRLRSGHARQHRDPTEPGSARPPAARTILTIAADTPAAPHIHPVAAGTVACGVQISIRVMDSLHDGRRRPLLQLSTRHGEAGRLSL